LEYTVRIIRWWSILRRYNSNTPVSSCAWPLLVSVAINNVMPLRLGDVVRVGFRVHSGIMPVQLLGSLIVERLLDVTTLLTFLVVGLANLDRGVVPVAYLEVVGALVCVALGSWIALTVTGGRLEGLLLRCCKHPVFSNRGLTEAVERHARGFVAALAILRSPSVVLELMSISAVVWACDGAIFATVGQHLGYIGNPFGPWFALSSATLATLVPSSPGYVGTFDFFAIWGFMAYGTGRTIAAAIAFVVHSIFWVSLTATGLVFVFTSKSVFPSRHLHPTLACEDE
jgi:glycosyltransferase 2 family protein